MVWPFDGIQQQLQRAPEQMVEGATSSVTNGVGGFLGRNWLLILFALVGGPVVASNFRERLPEGMSWLTDIGDFFIGLLSRIPFIGNFFGNMVQSRAEHWDKDEAQDQLEERMHLPPEVSNLLAETTEIWQANARWLRIEGRTTVMNPITEHSLTRMLTTDSGRDIARRLITGLDAARAAGWTPGQPATPAPAAGATPPAPGADFMAQIQGAASGLTGGDIVATIRSTLLQALRSRTNGPLILNDPEALNTLYSAVPAVTGIGFRPDATTALSTFVRASQLDEASKLALFTGMMGTPAQMEQTVTQLLTHQGAFANVPPAALEGLVRSIDATTAPEGVRPQILRMQAMNSDQLQAAFAAIGTVGPAALSGVTGTTPDAAADISRFARMLTAEPALTGAEIVSGMALADNVSAALRPLIVAPEGANAEQTTIIARHATAIRDLARGMGRDNFTAFATAAAAAQPDTAAIARIAGTEPSYTALRTFAAYIRTESATGQPLERWAASPEGRPIVTALADLASTTSAAQVRATGAALDRMDDAGEALVARLREVAPQGTRALLTELFDDDARGVLATGTNMQGFAQLVASLPDAATNPLAHVSGTGDNARYRNLDATLALIATIDAHSNPAEGVENAADVETALDARNARIVSFMLGFSQPGNVLASTTDEDGTVHYRWGTRTTGGAISLGTASAQEVGVTTEELSAFFGNVHNANAFHMFFGGQTNIRVESVNPSFDATTFAAGTTERRFFDYMRTHFWDNDDGNTSVSRGRPGHGFDVNNGEGIVEILADNESLSRLLRSMANRPANAPRVVLPETTNGNLYFFNTTDIMKSNWQEIRTLANLMPTDVSDAPVQRAPVTAAIEPDERIFPS